MDVSKRVGDTIIPQFAGINSPSIAFDDVRDGKRARVLYTDIDLSTTRSIAAGSALLLQIAGNAFFIDQNSSAGFATVYVQETGLSAKGAPLYVGPGFIARLPFTQILFENVAQAGKILRFVYGVDIDFLPGLSAAVTVSNTISVQGPRSLANGPVLADLPILTRDIGYVAGANYASTTPIAAGGTSQVFSPASNVNGAILWGAQAFTVNAAQNNMGLLAKSSAPITVIDGVLFYHLSQIIAGQAIQGPRIERARFIAAGLGLYWFSTLLESSAIRYTDYTLL